MRSIKQIDIMYVHVQKYIIMHRKVHVTLLLDQSSLCDTLSSVVHSSVRRSSVNIILFRYLLCS